MAIINNRMTLYFSPRKDKDLLDAFKYVDIDLNLEVKNLMRDGLKYRHRANKEVREVYVPPTVSVNHAPTIPVDSKSDFSELLDVKTEKREVSDEELESSFDEL